MENKKKLEEIASVELPSNGVYKFVLMDVCRDENVKSVLIGNPKCGYHMDIVDEYKSKLPLKTYVKKVLGGGRINVSDRNIQAYGTSYGFGTAPQDEVLRLLQDYVSNKPGVSLNVQMGKGY